MIHPDAVAAGHRYESSPFGCAVWCYAHDVPTMPCDFDCDWSGDCTDGCEHDGDDD